MPEEVSSVSAELSAPKETALAAFSPFQKLFAESATLLKREKDVSTPKQARELRLEMRKHRSACKQTKDTVKADIILAGRIADAYFNRVTGPLENAEARLDEIEKAEEIRIAKERDTRRVARIAELAEFGMDGAHFPLGEMLDAPYALLLAGAKLAHEAKIAAELKAKEDARIAAEKAEQERKDREAAEIAERERIHAENARLKAERDAAEELARVERERAVEQARIAAAERARIEAEAESARKAAKEKADREAAAAAEVARIEREKIEAAAREAAEKAKIEAKKAAEVARIERERREDMERVEQARIDAAVKAKRDAEMEAARAASAPDKEKLASLGRILTEMKFPDMETSAGHDALNRIRAKVDDVINAIRSEYKAMGKEVK